MRDAESTRAVVRACDSLTRILRDVLIYNQRNIVIPREKDRIRVEIEIAISKTCLFFHIFELQ